ncbi:MAG: potassium transporter [Desulfobacter sp.]|nr:potassium transporter [Desulfobacter sp.]WDP86093.1 MAG: potassium transporter [Desulfobacter sp.]
METIWIIGAGQFGLRAAKWLFNQEKKYEVTLVDLDENALVRATALGCSVTACDGSIFLNEHLTKTHGPDWIVPALPVHLAWEWSVLKMGETRLTPVLLPQEIDPLLPNPMRGAQTQIYVSHADFICPPNCNEPDDKCTKTGKPRKEDMFTLLSKIDLLGIQPFVIQSCQLGPGVGGYRPNVLFDLLDRLCDHQGPCFVATACRCHGVVSGGQVIS